MKKKERGKLNVMLREDVSDRKVLQGILIYEYEHICLCVHGSLEGNIGTHKHTQTKEEGSR